MVHRSDPGPPRLATYISTCTGYVAACATVPVTAWAILSQPHPHPYTVLAVIGLVLAAGALLGLTLWTLARHTRKDMS